ncbi:hypothetical protein AZE42_07255, partial [Rhizopogon vesiculosus]
MLNQLLYLNMTLSSLLQQPSSPVLLIIIPSTPYYKFTQTPDIPFLISSPVLKRSGTPSSPVQIAHSRMLYMNITALRVRAERPFRLQSLRFCFQSRARVEDVLVECTVGLEEDDRRTFPSVALV